jgi:hypothetical protein
MEEEAEEAETKEAMAVRDECGEVGGGDKMSRRRRGFGFNNGPGNGSGGRVWPTRQ